MEQKTLKNLYQHLKIDYNRAEILSFTNSINQWEQPRRRDNNILIPGIEVFRYTKQLFNCKEIKRLADLFNISYDKIQLYKFAPDFNYPPHIDLERTSVILFPLSPEPYAPIYFGDIPVIYKGALAVDTRERHAVYGNGKPRINLQFDMDITLDEIRNMYLHT